MINKLLTMGLLPADRIVIPKSDFQLIQHHGIYLGVDSFGRHLVAENAIGKGVSITIASEFLKGLNEVTRVEKFKGSVHERRKCIERALTLKGKSYDLVNFNCEHYSNFVQHSSLESPQLQKGVFIGVFALIVGGMYFAD